MNREIDIQIDYGEHVVKKAECIEEVREQRKR